MAEVEGVYDVVINEDKELLFCIRPRIYPPSSPRLFYDGGRRALLVRDSRQDIILDWLPPLTKEYLMEVDKVLIAEIDRKTQKLEQEYFVSLSVVRELGI